MRELELADWRRQVAELYAAVRAAEPRAAWNLWRTGRERLMLQHPQSPLPPAERTPARAPAYFDYDPMWRVAARLQAAAPLRLTLPGSSADDVVAERIGVVQVTTASVDVALSVYWLQEYSGGLFLSFRDAGSGTTTYGGGRYLLDTAKGADLGSDAGSLVLDFNFSYQPSCSYDAAWNCPLPPHDNWLDVAVNAGERLPS